MSEPTRTGESTAFPHEDMDCLYTHAVGTFCPIHGEIKGHPRCMAMSSGRCYLSDLTTTCFDGTCAKRTEWENDPNRAARS